MQEFLTVLDSRSIDRWNAFLAVHRGDAYAEVAREEVAKLIAAAKATAPAAEVLSGVSTNGKASNRTCRFPASGSRTRPHAFVHPLSNVCAVPSI